MNLQDSRTLRAVLVVLAALALVLPATAARAQATAGADEAQQAEEAAAETQEEPAAEAEEVFKDVVTVTAQKRSETLAEIPMSVTVLPADDLERQRLLDFRDLTAVVPGLSFTSAEPGVTRITLRGINTGGVASTVGVYVDDVPFGSSTGLSNAAILSGDFDTFDLARIEVLRGPQGTLYGASSLGGVLKYVPNRPSTEGYEARFQASVETVSGGDLGHAVTGVVNIPVSDSFALRASGFYRFDDGFIDSIGNNPIPSLTDPANNIFDGTLVVDGINKLDRSGGRLSALFEPSDRFSLLLTAQMQQIESDAPHTVDSDPVTLQPFESSPVQSAYHANFSNVDYEVFSATLDWDLGGATLQSVTSVGTLEQSLQTDAALATPLTGGLPLSSLITFLFGDPATRPLSVIFPSQVTTDKFTQELRLVSPESDSFEWLIGLYYTDEDSSIKQQLLAAEAGTDTVAADLPPLADISLVSTYEETALFANATWHVNDRFDLSLGGRASDNDQVASQVSDGALVGGLTAFDDTKSSESPFTFSVSPRYEIDDNTSVYARVATGFRPGGPNVLPPGVPADVPSTYDSDRLTSYEVGYKTSSEDGDVTLDIAAFQLDWEDIQLLTVVNNFGINGNGGTAESKGLEFTVSLRPRDGLLMSFNGAYTDAYLTQDTDPVVGGLNGDPLSWVPEWSFGAYGDYAWPVMGDAVAHFGGSISYTGDRPADFDERLANGSIRMLGSYMTVNLSAGIDFGGWNFEIFGRNLTDETAVTSIGAAGFLPNDAVGVGQIRPRSFGVSVGTSL